MIKDEKYSSKLLVEGNDDQIVVEALRKYHKLNTEYDVIDCQGLQNLLSRLDLYVNEQASQVTTIGIVVDADVDLGVRWDEIKDILNDAGGYIIPNDIPAGGLILTSSDTYKPKVGVWIMPDNNINGMLEDFILLLSPAGDNVLPEVDRVLTDIETKGINKYASIHKSKARIQTFLAWQKKPGISMGKAITKKILDPNLGYCNIFTDWLKVLFT